ncbi:unnamed protein product [Aphis gossypii]|uniref:Uncharacterized protein n=1 Tax=Aphis gossypii TaxID=80765 RepID=A0A9P0J2B9_APHGO|nr:unnamed protein product [Aphis gossypii]
MYFSISNLTIIYYMTVVVIFVNGDLDVSTEKCQDDLRTIGFDTICHPFNSLSEFVDENITLIRHPKWKFKTQEDLVKYESVATSYIKAYFKNFFIDRNVNIDKCTSAYTKHLVENILDPDNMLSVKTWCDINVINKDDLPEFIREESDKIFIDEIMYSKYYIKRIVKNTGLPKKHQLAHFKTLRVCFNGKFFELILTYRLQKIRMITNFNI